jgi:acyl carrier protein
MKNVEQEIAKIISRAAMVDVSLITPETKLTELGMDSLARIECVLSLEDAFQIEIDESELWKVKTVQDVMNAVTHVRVAHP